MNKKQLRKLKETYQKYLDRTGEDFNKGVFRRFKKDFLQARRDKTLDKV